MFSVYTNQHSLLSATNFLPPTSLNLFSIETACILRSEAQNTVEDFCFFKTYETILVKIFYILGCYSIPTPGSPIHDMYFHLLCLLLFKAA